MIGGFLGAGKTTAIARLAKTHIDAGRTVGLVTNDQAYNLVDTESLRAQGFDVGEVPGACFCCKFDDLVETAKQFGKAPDVIIAEPVGSCTDLVATVIEPMRHLYGGEYELGPLAVLLKPEHGLKILREEEGVGFSPKAAYIFLKQLEEADIIAVNKIDKLDAATRAELLELIQQKFPNKSVLAISAREGEGFGELVTLLEQDPGAPSGFMEVDYDIYAEGEAELGWLNCQVKFVGEKEFSLDELTVQLVDRVRTEMLNHGAEPAHLKVLGQSGKESAVANLVGSTVDAELSLESGASTQVAEVTVNARAATDPETLEKLVHQGVQSTGQALGLTSETTGMQRFRPGRPTPTHRMS